MDPKIKAIYFRLENLLATIPDSGKHYRINQSIVDSYHQAIDQLSSITDESFDHFKVSPSESEGGYGTYGDKTFWVTDSVKTQIASLLGHIKGIYSLDQMATIDSENNPIITVINQNTMAVTLNLTLSQLIEKSTDETEKEKLIELDKELKSPNKNWEKIKSILVWVADFSKDLFFQLLPIILKHYGVN